MNETFAKVTENTKSKMFKNYKDISEQITEISHVNIYVDSNAPRDSVCAFCTNIKKEHPKIQTEIKYYVNNTGESGDFYDSMLSAADSSGESLFVITDSPYACGILCNSEIAYAAWLYPEKANASYKDARYCIEDIEDLDLKTIERIWQRQHGLPWTVADTKRLVIREQTLSDLDALYEIYSDPDTTMYTEALYDDRSKEAEYLRQYISCQYAFYEYGIWALIDRESGRLAGRAGIEYMDGDEYPQIGYVIGSPFRRKGYAFEACRAIMKYAKDELGFECLIAYTRKENQGSIRLLDKLGFKPYGEKELGGIKHDRYLIKL